MDGRKRSMANLGHNNTGRKIYAQNNGYDKIHPKHKGTFHGNNYIIKSRDYKNYIARNK